MARSDFDFGQDGPLERTQRALSPTDPLVKFAEGAMLGPYRIEKVLSTGGMGILYVAQHEDGGRRLALKVLNPQFNQQPEFIRRFFDEARAVNKINHENIVEIYECVQQPNGLNYLVMELLEGADLWKTRKREGPFSMSRVLRVAFGTAAALEAAHAQQIVHRDLKPENIFLARRGSTPDFVKLLDFGIAKLSVTGSGGDVTRVGLVMGTPGFMAPEQALGSRVDERADIFAYGVVLYWMLSGKLPLDADELAALGVRDSQASRLGEISEAGELIPQTLRDLVQRCLVFNREERIPTMTRVIERLKGRSVSAPDPVATAPTQLRPPPEPEGEFDEATVTDRRRPEPLRPAPSASDVPVRTSARPRWGLRMAVIVGLGAGALVGWANRRGLFAPRVQVEAMVAPPVVVVPTPPPEEQPPAPAPVQAVPQVAVVPAPPPTVAAPVPRPAAPRPGHHRPKVRAQPEAPADGAADLMPVN